MLAQSVSSPSVVTTSLVQVTTATPSTDLESSTTTTTTTSTPTATATAETTPPEETVTVGAVQQQQQPLLELIGKLPPPPPVFLGSGPQVPVKVKGPAPVTYSKAKKSKAKKSVPAPITAAPAPALVTPPQPPLEVEESGICEIVIASVKSIATVAVPPPPPIVLTPVAVTALPPPPPPVSVGHGGRKRSRKQQISTLRDEISLVSPPSNSPKKKVKRAAPGAGAAVASAGSKKKKNNNNNNSGEVEGEIVVIEHKKNPPKRARPTPAKRNLPTASTLLKRFKEQGLSDKVTTSLDGVSISGPEERVVLESPGIVSVKRFKVFHDSSRDIPAIGPSQVVLAAEALIEPGVDQDICKQDTDSDNNEVVEVGNPGGAVKKLKFETSFLLDKFLSCPHFLPLSTVYGLSVPFTRVVKFSALFEYTGGVRQENVCETYRYLHGKELVRAKGFSSTKGEGFLRNTIVIKYPVISKYSKKPVFFKFFVLKKVQIQGNEVGILKGKILTIKRSEDNNNISIQIADSSITELPSDANAMNQQNIQPVIHTDTDLVPLLGRTTGYLHQQQHHQQQYQAVVQAQQHYQQQQQPHFQYVSYQYQSPTELTLYEPEQRTLVAASGSNFAEASSYNYLNHHQVNQTPVPVESGSDEHGNQILIFCNPEPEPQSSLSTGYLQELQYQQQQLLQEEVQVIHHQQGVSAYRSVPAQPQQVIVQQRQALHQNQNQAQQSNFYAVQQPQQGSAHRYTNQNQTIQGQIIGRLETGEYIILQPPSPTKTVVPVPVVSNNQAQQQQQQFQQQQVAQVQVKVEQQQNQNHHQTPVVIQRGPQQAAQINQRQIVVQERVVNSTPAYHPQQQHQPPVVLQPGNHQQSLTRPTSSVQQVALTQTQRSQVVSQVQQRLAAVQRQPQQGNQLQFQYQSVIQKPVQTQQLPRPQIQQHQHQSVITYPPQGQRQHPVAVPSGPLQDNLHPPTNQQLPTPESIAAKAVEGLSNLLKPKAPKGKGKKNKNAESDIVCLTPQGGGQPPAVAATSNQAGVTPGSSATTQSQVTLVSGKSSIDIVRIAAGSASPQSAGTGLAGKVYSSISAFTSPTGIPRVGSSVSSASSVVSGSEPIPDQAPQAPEKPSRKPGFLAVCPHCGSSGVNILKCSRCKVDFPEDVKLIPDQWSVKTGVAVLSAAPKSEAVLAVSESGGKKATTISASAPLYKKGLGQKKIVVINRPPAILNPPVKGGGTPLVEVKIQPDGGSCVTVVHKGGLTGVTKSALGKSPAPRKRPANRRKIQECITLSSDEEEPEEAPKPKIVKVEPASSDNSSKAVEVATAVGNNNIVSEKVGGAAEPGAVSQAPAPVQKEEEVEVKKPDILAVPDTPATTPVIPEETDMARRKTLSINLSPDEGVAVAQPKEEDADVIPEKVIEKIEEKMNSPGSKFEYTVIECRSIRVGSYKVTDADFGSLKVTLTALGILFTLPFANSKHRMKTVCIPNERIVGIQANLNKKLPVLFIKTGPKYAGWIRDALGMDGSPDNKHSNYYCPVKGSSCQRAITMLAGAFSDAEVGIIRTLFADTLQEIDYEKANKFLMDITPDSYRSCIRYEPDPDSPAAASKTAKTNSSHSNVVKPAAPASEQSVSTSTSATVKAAALSAAPPAASKADFDQEAAILFYEGNKVKIPISPKDITCLGYSQFLNDQIIDFWLSVIHTEFLSEEDRNRTFVFDSFFYSKLTEKKKKCAEDGNLNAAERRHARVKKRTKNVDIFEKDFLVVPINENYHWFIVIICFPGMQGFHDYDSLEPLPDYRTKKPKLVTNAKDSKPKPIVSKQPQSNSTASYSDRDEAPEDPEEASELSNMGNASSEDSQPSPPVNDPGQKATAGVKRKAEDGEQRVKQPCILLFDSLAGDQRARIYSTLRDYLKIEYKAKKNEERLFDKATIPGIMPKVPQQPNFSDCGLFMLQYIESFFANPVLTYDTKVINLKTWFEPSLAENKRREIYDFIKKKIEEKCPQNLCRVPEVSFEGDGTEDMDNDDFGFGSRDRGTETDEDDPDYEDEEDDEDLFVPVQVKGKKVVVAVTTNANHTPAATAAATSTTTTRATTTTLGSFRTSPAKPKATNTNNTIMISLMSNPFSKSK